jgi:hypothetical protein
VAWRTFSTGVLGGLNENENPHSLEPNELVEAFNCWRTGDSVGTRPGTVREGSGAEYESQCSTGAAITGMVEYRQNFDAARAHIVVSGANIHYQDGATLPSGPTITAGLDNKWTFALHNNLLWGMGGGPNDDAWAWDGNTGNAPSTITLTDKTSGQNFRAQYVFTWRNYMLASGFRVATQSNSINPSIVRYCTFGADPELDASWLDSNSIGFQSTNVGLEAYGATYSTGFAKFQSNEGHYLLLLTNKQISTAVLDADNDFRVVDAIANGCVGQDAFVPLGLDSGDAIYFSEFGIHSLRQSQQFGGRDNAFLSWKIRPTFASLNRNRLSKTVGAYDSDNGIVVFAVSTGSNPQHDTLLVLDVKDLDNITAENARWYKWAISFGSETGEDFNINSMHFARSEGGGEKRLYFGTTNGDVGYFDTDTFSDFDSAGGSARAYSVRFRTKDRADFSGSAERGERGMGTLHEKQLGDVMVTLQPGGTYKPSMKFIFDFGQRTSSTRSLNMPASAAALVGFAQVGTAQVSSNNETRDELVRGYGRGRTIGFEFTHGTAQEPFRVGRIDYQVDLGGESAGDT